MFGRPWTPSSDHEVPESRGPREEGLGRELKEGPRGQYSCLGGQTVRVVRMGRFRGSMSLTQSYLPSHTRLSHETKLCEQMVLMVLGLGRNPPRQAGQRV